MKKIVLILSALFICALLSGCSNSNSNSTPLSELYQGQITMNGVSYSVPFSIKNLDINYKVNTTDYPDETYHEIIYDGKYYALALSDTGSTVVKEICFDENSRFKLGEIYHGNTIEKIEKAHGSGDYRVEFLDNIHTCYYLNKEVVLSITYTNKAVTFIAFNFDGSMRENIESAQKLAEEIES